MPGYLGNYDSASVFTSIWHGQAFYCHTLIDYEDENWAEEAEENGKLCLGGLVYASHMMAPLREVDDPSVRAAREKFQYKTAQAGIECMTPKEFLNWHKPENIAANLEILRNKKRIK